MLRSARIACRRWLPENSPSRRSGPVNWSRVSNRMVPPSFMIGVDAGHGCRLGIGPLGGDRPIEHRVEGQFVTGDVDASGLARLQRGARGEKAGQPDHAGAADIVQLRVAGDDIGELGDQRCRKVDAAARRGRGILLRIGPGRCGKDSRQEGRRRQWRPPRPAMRRKAWQAQRAGDPQDRQAVERQQQGGGQQQPRPEGEGGAAGIGRGLDAGRDVRASSKASLSPAANRLSAEKPSLVP